MKGRDATDPVHAVHRFSCTGGNVTAQAMGEDDSRNAGVTSQARDGEEGEFAGDRDADGPGYQATSPR